MIFGDEVEIYDFLNSTENVSKTDEDIDLVIHTVSWTNSKEVSMGGHLKLKIQRSTAVISYNKLIINDIEQQSK